MNYSILQLTKDFYESQGIQVLHLTAPYNHLEKIDYEFRKQLFLGFNYSDFLNPLKDAIQANILYHIEDDFHLYYSVLLLSDSYELNVKNSYICIGPVLFQPLSQKHFDSVLKEKQMPLETQSNLHEFYNRIPVVSNFDNWSASLLVFLSKLIDKPLTSMFFSKKDIKSHLISLQNYIVPNSPTIAMQAIEERYQLEKEIMNSVSHGNMQQALDFHTKFRQYKINPRTPDSLRNTKNMLIVLNTLLRKAVQDGYVHPLHIDNLSTQMALQIEYSTSQASLDTFASTMIRKYCMLVKNHSRKSYSYLIQVCLDHIDFHYAEELSLDYLANMCSVSNSYLSTLFKKETGTTITDHINNTRIRQSTILLNTTTLSIQEIAEKCGFSDANYFTRTFKKFQGKSPKNYRREIRNI